MSLSTTSTNSNCGASALKIDITPTVYDGVYCLRPIHQYYCYHVIVNHSASCYYRDWHCMILKQLGNDSRTEDVPGIATLTCALYLGVNRKTGGMPAQTTKFAITRIHKSAHIRWNDERRACAAVFSCCIAILCTTLSSSKVPQPRLEYATTAIPRRAHASRSSVWG
jgi:hypothetical protein